MFLHYKKFKTSFMCDIKLWSSRNRRRRHRHRYGRHRCRRRSGSSIEKKMTNAKGNC
jgi:hypothetical protein